MILWRIKPKPTTPKGSEWHRWFAWHPVWAQPKVSSDTYPVALVWLRVIWRQNISGRVHDDPVWRYVYGGERPR